jgi:hypothetical protein
MLNYYIMSQINYSIGCCVLMIAFIIIIISLAHCMFSRKIETATNIPSFQEDDNSNKTPMYCLMITGKDDTRYKFAKVGIINFNYQSYPNKYLIIINHGHKKLLADKIDNIIEIMVDKKGKTLGDLRNLSLSYVPNGSIWTTWDDDDWRVENYLEELYDVLTKNDADVVVFKNRIDYNLNNNASWIASFDTGTMIFTMYKDPKIVYDSLDSNEDRVIKDNINTFKKVIIHDNDPIFYVRNIHKTNTSIFVDATRNSHIQYADTSDYHEYPVTDKQKEYTNEIYNKYYKDI